MTNETLFARLDPIVRQFVDEMVKREHKGPVELYAAGGVLMDFMLALREANAGRPELLKQACVRVLPVPDGIVAYPDSAGKAT